MLMSHCYGTKSTELTPKFYWQISFSVGPGSPVPHVYLYRGSQVPHVPHFPKVNWYCSEGRLMTTVIRLDVVIIILVAFWRHFGSIGKVRYFA